MPAYGPCHRDLRLWADAAAPGQPASSLRGERGSWTRLRPARGERARGGTAERPAASKLDGDPQDLIRAMPAEGDRPAGAFASPMIAVRPPQLHCELVASVKLLTELTTLDASLVTVATCVAEGLDPSTADRALQRADRGGDRAGLAGEVALGRVDQRGGVALDLRQLGFQGADAHARQSLDGVLQAGAVRAVRRLAATCSRSATPPRSRRTAASRAQARADLALMYIVTTSSARRVHHP